MTGWVLILYLFWTNPAIAVLNVSTEEDCKRIGEVFVKNSNWFHASYVCVEAHK